MSIGDGMFWLCAAAFTAVLCYTTVGIIVDALLADRRARKAREGRR